MDLSDITPVPLEFLSHSEHREVFRDGDKLVPAVNGLMQIHLRFPGGEPFTAHVTWEVFERFFLPLYPEAPETPSPGSPEALATLLESDMRPKDSPDP